MTAVKPLVLPFRGERYARPSLERVLAPPYDVISPEARKTLAARDPHNIVHLILPEAAVAEEKYAHAARLLGEWRAAGVLAPDPGPAVYVVAQDYTLPSGERRTRVGMLAAVSAEPYETRAGSTPRADAQRPQSRSPGAPEENLKTGLESIFLLAPTRTAGLTKALLEVTQTTPAAQGTLDGVGHRLWVVSGKAGDQLAQRASVGALYIADGHHRYETAVAYAKENPGADRVMAFIVSAHDPGLVVLPTHRVIYGAGRDVSHLVEQWKLWFEVTSGNVADPLAHLAKVGASHPACFVALPTNGLTLVLRPNAPLDDIPGLGKSPALRSLDVAVIEPLVVKQILGAGTSTPTLTYTPDGNAALDAVRQGRAAASVLLNATKVSQVVAVADAGEVMPQKSTYFVPKVPAGLVLKP